ncbi:hypothetical protein BU16DRAFT_536157 [Lophium mytilinum]|uniref:Chromo domain-containing protein n=1 Tax=Lophium mytilinum TaxID=390894 RepID=A0A6A6R806_9PEZI|nr:hypothetical protein BU16DRAFT_536157 [Lophium mytilinum]
MYMYRRNFASPKDVLTYYTSLSDIESQLLRQCGDLLRQIESLAANPCTHMQALGLKKQYRELLARLHQLSGAKFTLLQDCANVLNPTNWGTDGATISQNSRPMAASLSGRSNDNATGESSRSVQDTLTVPAQPDGPVRPPTQPSTTSVSGTVTPFDGDEIDLAEWPTIIRTLEKVCLELRCCECNGNTLGGRFIRGSEGFRHHLERNHDTVLSLNEVVTRCWMRTLSEEDIVALMAGDSQIEQVPCLLQPVVICNSSGLFAPALRNIAELESMDTSASHLLSDTEPIQLPWDALTDAPFAVDPSDQEIDRIVEQGITALLAALEEADLEPNLGAYEAGSQPTTTPHEESSISASPQPIAPDEIPEVSLSEGPQSFSVHESADRVVASDGLSGLEYPEETYLQDDPQRSKEEKDVLEQSSDEIDARLILGDLRPADPSKRPFLSAFTDIPKEQHDGSKRVRSDSPIEQTELLNKEDKPADEGEGFTSTEGLVHPMDEHTGIDYPIEQIETLEEEDKPADREEITLEEGQGEPTDKHVGTTIEEARQPYTSIISEAEVSELLTWAPIVELENGEFWSLRCVRCDQDGLKHVPRHIDDLRDHYIKYHRSLLFTGSKWKADLINICAAPAKQGHRTETEDMDRNVTDLTSERVVHANFVELQRSQAQLEGHWQHTRARLDDKTRGTLPPQELAAIVAHEQNILAEFERLATERHAYTNARNLINRTTNDNGNSQIQASGDAPIARPTSVPSMASCTAATPEDAPIYLAPVPVIPAARYYQQRSPDWDSNSVEGLLSRLSAWGSIVRTPDRRYVELQCFICNGNAYSMPGSCDLELITGVEGFQRHIARDHGENQPHSARAVLALCTRRDLGSESDVSALLTGERNAPKTTRRRCKAAGEAHGPWDQPKQPILPTKTQTVSEIPFFRQLRQSSTYVLTSGGATLEPGLEDRTFPPLHHTSPHILPADSSTHAGLAAPVRDVCSLSTEGQVQLANETRIVEETRVNDIGLERSHATLSTETYDREKIGACKQSAAGDEVLPLGDLDLDSIAVGPQGMLHFPSAAPNHRTPSHARSTSSVPPGQSSSSFSPYDTKTEQHTLTKRPWPAALHQQSGARDNPPKRVRFDSPIEQPEPPEQEHIPISPSEDHSILDLENHPIPLQEEYPIPHQENHPLPLQGVHPIAEENSSLAKDENAITGEDHLIAAKDTSLAKYEEPITIENQTQPPPKQPLLSSFEEAELLAWAPIIKLPNGSYREIRCRICHYQKKPFKPRHIDTLRDHYITDHGRKFFATSNWEAKLIEDCAGDMIPPILVDFIYAMDRDYYYGWEIGEAADDSDDGTISVTSTADSNDYSSSEEFPIERILAENDEGGEMLYLIKWADQGLHRCTWEPASALSGMTILQEWEECRVIYMYDALEEKTGPQYREWRGYNDHNILKVENAFRKFDERRAARRRARRDIRIELDLPAGAEHENE